MADNVTLPATGAVVRTSNNGGVETQIFKLDVGADGAETLAGNGAVPISTFNLNTAPVVPTIQNAAYAAGNCMGGLQTVSFFRTTAQPSGILNQFLLGFLGTETTPITVYIFGKNPATTFADKASPTWTAADSKLLVVPPFTLVPAAPSYGITTTFANYLFAASVMNLDGSPSINLYVALIAGASVTPAVGDLWFSMAGTLD